MYAFYVLFDVNKCGVFVCGVFEVVESSLFILSGCCMCCKKVE